MTAEHQGPPVGEVEVSPLDLHRLAIDTMIASSPVWNTLPSELKGIATNIALPIALIEDTEVLKTVAERYEIAIDTTASLVVMKAEFVRKIANRKLTQLFDENLGTENAFTFGQKANTTTLAVAALNPTPYRPETSEPGRRRQTQRLPIGPIADSTPGNKFL